MEKEKINLRVYFYAEGFRSIELQVDKKLEEYPEHIKRNAITRYICERMDEFKPLPALKKWIPYEDNYNGYDRSVMIIVAKIIWYHKI